MYSVLIRSLIPEDAEISYRWRNDPEIWRYTESKPKKIITAEEEKKWIKEVLVKPDEKRFAIQADNRYVGNIQITNIKEGQSGEYHIFIGEKLFWGKGIAKLASAQLIRYAREVLKLKELYLKVDPEHQTGIHLYEKIGFNKVNGEIRMTLNPLTAKDTLLSVMVLTYNHEPFIKQALEGILMQNTNFDFEIVIGEDLSTDKTREIIIDIARKFPGKFNLLFHEKNIGPLGNQFAVLNACSGKYIAICEGDDFWTDNKKLQKQVNFLENNPEYVMCTHNHSILNEDDNQTNRKGKYNSDFSYDSKRFLSEWVTPTLTSCFRNTFRNYKWLKNGNMFSDYFLFYELLKHGQGYFMKENMATYRVHKNGVCSGLSKEQRILNHIEMLKQLSLSNPYDILLKEKLADYYLAHFNYELRVKKSVKIDLEPVCGFYLTEPDILKKFKASFIFIPFYITKYWIPNLLKAIFGKLWRSH
jgi:RimJ/RimL family protein N-acetyltransferase/glycosyltransferase involved in cell wall biosynthesis